MSDRLNILSILYPKEVLIYPLIDGIRFESHVGKVWIHNKYNGSYLLSYLLNSSNGPVKRFNVPKESKAYDIIKKFDSSCVKRYKREEGYLIELYNAINRIEKNGN